MKTTTASNIPSRSRSACRSIRNDRARPDLTGASFGYTMGAEAHLLTKTKSPVMSGTRVAILPSKTLAESPDLLDIVFVPSLAIARRNQGARQ